MIGVPHPKWSERPLLVIVRAPKSNVAKEEILTWLNVSPLLLLTEGLLQMSALHISFQQQQEGGGMLHLKSSLGIASNLLPCVCRLLMDVEHAASLTLC